MLLVIDDSVAQVLQGDSGPHDELVGALELIAHAHRRGVHLVFASLQTLALVRDCTSLSSVGRAEYTAMYNRYPETGTYLRRLARRVEIVASDGVFELVDSEGCQVLRLSAKYVVDRAILSETMFLVENRSDVDIYKKIANTYAEWEHLGSIWLRCEPRGGGGSTIAPEFDAIQKEGNRLCLCITDSDRAAPLMGIGETARATKRVYREPRDLCELRHLKFRAIENLIPTGIYREVSVGDPNRTKGVECLEALESLGLGECRYYVNIRKGLVLRAITSEPASSPAGRYWRAALSTLTGKLEGIADTCWATIECRRKDDCTCIVLHGLGPNILESAAKELNRRNGMNLKPIIDDALREEWLSLGRLITDWCCGTSPRAA